MTREQAYHHVSIARSLVHDLKTEMRLPSAFPDEDATIVRELAQAAARNAMIFLRWRDDRASRQARTEVYRSCGLKRVRGNLGGVYWE